MDTSETYIKMCKEGYPHLKEDVPLFSRRRRMYYVVGEEVGLWWDIVNISNHNIAFPLWEQDQLQKMICKDWGLQTICTRLEEFSKASDGGISITISGSMEQLWLAFVMKKKYNKIWDGTQWLES